MSFDTFRSEPKSYLSSHKTVRISQNGSTFASVNSGVALPVPGGGTSRQYTHKANAPFTTVIPFMNIAAQNEKTEGMRAHNVVARHVGLAGHLGFAEKLTRVFQSTASGADVGLRWLPYELGFVTYMAMDAAATFALTGELSGCTVGVGSAGGTPYYFHSFAPNGHHGLAARNIQRAMIDHIANGIGIQQMHYAENTIDYDGFAFSFGKRKSLHSPWKFYIYGSNTGTAKIVEI
jgi:hypothetical protein